jgi:hypothetical protein
VSIDCSIVEVDLVALVVVVEENVERLNADVVIVVFVVDKYRYFQIVDASY